MVQYDDEFRADFIKWQGREPHGNYGHWCNEWDDLPIDELCTEITACSCFDTPEFHRAQQLQEHLMEERAEGPSGMEQW